jgi:mannitol/fructose-specific phosphotransferase system IIA component (Ntr-type)
MTKPTFSILVDSEENTNLAIKQLTQIALEQGIITEQDLEEIDKKTCQVQKCGTVSNSE